MKKLQRMMTSAFVIGFISVLFYSFGLLSREWYGTGLYAYESSLLLVWIIIMFGTAFYYGLVMVILYPDEVRKSIASKKRHHF